jgi:voltage-gated potassium channel
MLSSQIYKKLYISGIGLLSTILIGTFGYWFITGKQYEIFDCFFMTFITITTIGFGEIIPLQNYAGARLFTVFIALAGIGFITYFLSTLAAIVIEGYYKKTYLVKKMTKDISKLENHYILCGLNPYTDKIIDELIETDKGHVVIDPDEEKLNILHNNHKKESYVEGDPTEDEILRKAGIERAKGLFAATDDDNVNLVISLSAKRLNPKLRVVAFCFNLKNAEKMELAGADRVVSPTNIGGIRMASEMLRPTVTNFLDFMLREDNKSSKIEEIMVSAEYHGKTMKEIDISGLRSTMVMAIKNKDGWIFKPGEDFYVYEGDVLIVMTTSEERKELENKLSGD